ncbi:MAG: redoxin domain-containing protein, partial [Blastocatellia bacterium]|nr:redoxin domain-containing protein [Blastocatellia bacterium]
STYEDRKLWPNDWSFWWSRFNAVRNLENSTGNEIEEAGENLLKALKQNAFEVMMLPPIPLQVAQAYAKRNVATARIPSLVLEGIKATERMEKRNPPSDLYPRKAGDTGNGNLKYVQWLSWPLLAEAYARLGQAEKAREALKEMAEALNRDKPGDQAREEDKLYYSNHQVTYWQTVAKVAEAENRKLDALISYQTALSFRPKSSKPRAGTKDGLADDTSRLWKELGGTDEGLQAYLARNESPKFAVAKGEFATWETKVQQLADFNMLDLRGKKWRLADLKGKVTFINLWATYCGPCVDELPYVQKLHEQMKDNKDVLVLTLNLDAEVSRVEAFIRDKKYSFTVIPAEAYAEEMDVFSIPRNWIVSAGGTLQFEYRGFDGNGNEWLKQATEMIRKVQGVK